MALGNQEEDNGLLILVAMAERKMRIEVGYGLEGRIPDVTANRVIEEVLKPEFRAGRFGEGIETAVQQLIQMARGETPAPNSGRNTISWFEKLLIEGFLLLFQGMMIFGWFLAAAHVWVLLDLDRLPDYRKTPAKGQLFRKRRLLRGGQLRRRKLLRGRRKFRRWRGLRELVGTPSSLIRRRSYPFSRKSGGLGREGYRRPPA